jgi:transcriptional regulator with XRE-family HTH domain
MKQKQYRDGYVAAQIALGLPSKIRALRLERKWTQGDLARLAKMAQPRISEIETPGERKLNLETLRRIASAFDVGLEVNFVPFGELINRSEGFDPDSFSVQGFEPEVAEATVSPKGKRQRRSKCFYHTGSRSKRTKRKYKNSSHIPSCLETSNENGSVSAYLIGQAPDANPIALIGSASA